MRVCPVTTSDASNKFSNGSWATKQIALSKGHTRSPQDLKLPLGLNSLSCRCHVQAAGQADDSTDDCHASFIVLDIHDKGTIDFDLVEWKLLQVPQRQEYPVPKSSKAIEIPLFFNR